MQAKLILLSGKMGHGKTTAAQYLENNLSGVIRRKSFAAPLKTISQLFGLTNRQCWGTLEDKKSLTNWKWEELSFEIQRKFSNGGLLPKGFLTAREFMQVFGTDVIRNSFSKDAWVKLMHHEITQEAEQHRTLYTTPIYFLIDDCRMPNELVNHPSVETIKVRITRPGMPTSNHESETALDGIPEVYYDFIINNDGSMEDYYYKLSKLLDHIG